MNDETLARLTAARKQLRLIDEDGATTHGTRFLIEIVDE